MAVLHCSANGVLQQIVQPFAYGAALGIHPLAVLIVTIAGGSSVRRDRADPGRAADLGGREDRGGPRPRPRADGGARRHSCGSRPGRHGCGRARAGLTACTPCRERIDKPPLGDPDHRGGSRCAAAVMLLVRRRAPEGSYFADGDRAAGVFGVIATGFAVLLGLIVFLAFESYDQSRSGAEAEARLVVAAVRDRAVPARRRPSRPRTRAGLLLAVRRERVAAAGVRGRRQRGDGEPLGGALFRTLKVTNPRSATEQTRLRQMARPHGRARGGPLGPHPRRRGGHTGKSVGRAPVHYGRDLRLHAVLRRQRRARGHPGVVDGFRDRRDRGDVAADQVPRRPVPATASADCSRWRWSARRASSTRNVASSGTPAPCRAIGAAGRCRACSGRLCRVHDRKDASPGDPTATFGAETLSPESAGISKAVIAIRRIGGSERARTGAGGPMAASVQVHEQQTMGLLSAVLESAIQCRHHLRRGARFVACEPQGARAARDASCVRALSRSGARITTHAGPVELAARTEELPLSRASRGEQVPEMRLEIHPRIGGARTVDVRAEPLLDAGPSPDRCDRHLPGRRELGVRRGSRAPAQRRHREHGRGRDGGPRRRRADRLRQRRRRAHVRLRAGRDGRP